ncbi:6942_t:CDS:1, partial [Acaulospora morrowiae]
NFAILAGKSVGSSTGPTIEGSTFCLKDRHFVSKIGDVFLGGFRNHLF